MRLTDEQRAANADTLALLEYIRQGGALPDDYSDSALADRIDALRAALARIDELETALRDIFDSAPTVCGGILRAAETPRARTVALAGIVDAAAYLCIALDKARALLQPAAPEAHDG